MRKPLIITLAVVLLLGGVYAALVMTSDEEPEPKPPVEGEAPEMEQGEFVLSDMPATSIMAMRYTSNGNTVDLKYTVHGWQAAEDENIPLNQTVLEGMAKTMSNVSSDRLLTSDRSKFSDFGLDPVNIRVELEDSDGKTYVYNIGNKHPSTHMYYFNVEGTDDVYTVPTLVGRDFANYPTLESILDVPRYHYASTDNIEAVTIEKGGKKTELIHLPEGNPYCYSEDYKWFFKSGEDFLPLSDSEFEIFLNTIAGIGAQSGTAYAPDEQSRAPYGLDKDYYTVGVSYNSSERGYVTDTFYLGQGDDGKVYGRTEGSDVIGQTINTFDFFDFDYERFKAQDFFKMHQETVDEMTIVLGENRYVIKGTHESTPDTEKAAPVKSTFTFGDNVIPEEYMTTFFNTMRNTVAEGPAPEDAKPSGEPYMDIVFERNTESFPHMEMKLWKYDSSFYISEFNGNRLLINKMDVQKIADALSAAIEASKN